jgi:hypothetical protein
LPHLTHLSLHLSKLRGQKALESFPNSVLHLSLSFNNHFHDPLPSLPPKLLSLEIGHSYTYPNPICFPSTLTELSFGSRFDMPWLTFPPSLLCLAIDLFLDDVNPLPPLPSSLLSLTLGYSVAPLPPLPQGLKTLNILDEHYPHALTLPPSLMLLVADQPLVSKLGNFPETCCVMLCKHYRDLQQYINWPSIFNPYPDSRPS